MRRSSRITLPICACGTLLDFNSDRTRPAFFGSQEITMRDCASLKRMAHAICAVEPGVSPAVLSCSPPARRPLQADKSISAPSSLSGLKQLSVTATASPPSLQSCALLTKPSRIKSRTAFCTAISSSISNFGTGPIFFPKQTLRKRDAPRL